MDNELLTIINASDIGEDDKKMWSTILEGLPENFSNDIKNYLVSNPSGVTKITDNLKSKLELIKNNDSDAFEELLKSEVQNI